MIGALFWALTAIGCGYAALQGGRDGRWAAVLLLSASVLTIPATRLGSQWGATEYGILIVDLALAIGLYVLTLKSVRFFPIWMTGFHLAAVASHLSTMLVPDFAPNIYRALGGMWAIPVTLSMMWGIHLDRRSASTRARQEAEPGSTIPKNELLKQWPPAT